MNPNRGAWLAFHGNFFESCDHCRDDSWSYCSKLRNLCRNQDCWSWWRSGGYSWLYFTLLYNCNPAGIYLHEIPENVPSPGNSYIPSPGGCGHDRQGRSYHFSIIFFYKWCSGTVSGKHMHSNGGVLYCRTGAFKKI